MKVFVLFVVCLCEVLMARFIIIVGKELLKEKLMQKSLEKNGEKKMVYERFNFMLDRKQDNMLKALAGKKSKSEFLRGLIAQAFDKDFGSSKDVSNNKHGVYNACSDYSELKKENNSADSTKNNEQKTRRFTV